MRPRRRLTIIGLILVLSLTLAACGGTASSPSGPNEQATPPQNNNVFEAPEANLPVNNVSGDRGEADGDFTPLPADPTPVGIPTADDRVLEGLYYPSRIQDAPAVVLMHWANGSLDDWRAVAPWLQNRLDELIDPLTGGGPLYTDSSWFPPMPEEVSFAVLVFNFGDFGNSPYGGSRQTWVDDAVSALNFASSLEGIDPHRLSTLGASIGADGAVDSCYLFNDAGEMGTCVGALSLSPGNYLTDEFAYPEAADFIEMAGYPVWCLAAEGDGSSPELCLALDGEHAQAFIFEGRDHGMNLLTDDQTLFEPALGMDYNPMEMIQEFLETAYQIPMNEFEIP